MMSADIFLWQKVQNNRNKKRHLNDAFFVLMVELRRIFLLKFTLFIFKFANLSFGHSVAICSSRVAYANLLTSNLRPSLKISPPEIFFSSGSLPTVSRSIQLNI